MGILGVAALWQSKLSVYGAYPADASATGRLLFHCFWKTILAGKFLELICNDFHWDTNDSIQ